MRLPIAIVIVVSSFFFFSCEKTISVLPPSYQGKASIQSMLEPDSLPIVYFNRTVPYFDKKINFAELAIRNAVVQISSAGTIDILKLDSVFDKVYCQYNYYYKGNSPIQLNKNYTLTITSGTDTYTATATIRQVIKGNS
ncbi:MAG: hypothetical protein JWP81_4986 [Ferruginibacter sp.]|nr:hypothetical protein [Ferruginibacter sp.]